MEGSVYGRDLNQNTHVNNSYVVSVRCSRFEERNKCASEHERAQVAEVDVRKRRVIDCKTSHTLSPCYPGLHLGSWRAFQGRRF